MLLGGLFLAPSWAVLGAVCAGAPVDGTSLDEQLAASRSAHRIVAFVAGGKELLLEGTTTMNGLTGAWTLRVAPDGRFVTAAATRLQERDGFDGSRTWHVDPSGLARFTTFEAREHLLLRVATSCGLWCAPNGPLVPLRLDPPAVTSAESATSTTCMVSALWLRAKDGVVESQLALDAATSLPSALTLDLYRGREQWTFAGWDDVAGGPRVAHELVIDDDGQQSSWRVDDARLVDPDPAAFAFPATRPDDVEFAAALPSRVPGKLAPSGHLLVHAQIDGADHGWFVFDSGAGQMVLAPRLARALALEPFGEYWLGGAGAGRTAGHFFQAHDFSIGPVTIKEPRFGELDLDSLSASFGEKVVGICGYDLLQRVVASVDMKRGTVDLFDPATFQRDGERDGARESSVTWRPLLLHGNHPHVTCTFAHDGDEEGVFRLDTGAARVSVLFHSPFVKQLGLLAEQTTAPFRGLGGVGGESAARIGTVPWFEIGGVTIDEPRVIFIEDQRGALADPWTAGTIGGSFLDRFDLIFDYPHDRVGFVPHAAGK